MTLSVWNRKIFTFIAAMLMCCSGFADDTLYRQARTHQHEGNYNEAIEAFNRYLSLPISKEGLTDQQVVLRTEALMQLMNTYQSKGEPEACIEALQEVFKASPLWQGSCLRDYYVVMGYALSRTERMQEAEETMLKALTLPLHRATPERYFRDYAYAAAVFYSNPDYQDEVIEWCQEAIAQAEECQSTSGKQWVTTMLGSLYKRDGQFNKALELYKVSIEEAQAKGDELGALNCTHALIDLFLYWGIPEYANRYATQALAIEQGLDEKNPMVSTQTYIYKGRALLALGITDSVSTYTLQARKLSHQLPYNSGMVDVDLLHGTFLTQMGGDSLQAGIEILQHVTREATPINRARAYHQLAQTYIKSCHKSQAEIMLDSMYALLGSSTYIALDYAPIINHYLEAKNHSKVEQYVRLMMQERQALKAKRLSYDLIETIAQLESEQKRQQQKIEQLRQVNQRLWFLVGIVLLIVVLSGVVIYLIYQKRQHVHQMRQAEERLFDLKQKLQQSQTEKEMRAQEIKEFLNTKDNRQELETLTPTLLQTDGESKFRQYFELLYPLFLPRLREKVPSVTPREELLSMLVVLKQDNKRIAELLAIAPRSVLMLRHRFRQKIGIDTELSLESFIEGLLADKSI